MKTKKIISLLIALTMCVSALAVPVSAASITKSISSGQNYIHTTYILSSNGNVSMTGNVKNSSNVGGRFRVLHYQTPTLPVGVGQSYDIYPGGSFNTGMVYLGKTNYGGSIYPITGTSGTTASVTITTP